MLVNKVEFIPTIFDGIEEVIDTAMIEVTTSRIIKEKINTSQKLVNAIRYIGLDLLSNSSDNLLGIYNEIRNIYAERVFAVKDNFKIDGKYLNYIIKVIEEKWDEKAAKVAIDTQAMGFHEIQKIIKEKGNITVKSWEELEKENLLNFIEFKHVKENIRILRSLFFYYLLGNNNVCNNKYIFMAQNKGIKELINQEGLFSYITKSSCIDKFECFIDRAHYLCDYNGITITMYPYIVDLMNDHEIQKFKNTSLKHFGKSQLIIETTLGEIDKIENCKININYDQYYKQFSRQKSTSTLYLSGINSSSFVINFNLTGEEVKIMLAKFGQKKVGLKNEVMERLGQLCQDLSVEHEEELAKYFNSNMVVKFNNNHINNQTRVEIKGIDESIVYMVMYVYIKNRTHGSALFLKDKLNGLYNAANDFSRKNNPETVQYMRTNEGIA